MHFQDSLLCKWKQGEKWNCPNHGASDNQRNNRTVQLQAERDQGYLGCQGQQSHWQEQGSQGGEFIDSHCPATLRRDKYF